MAKTKTELENEISALRTQLQEQSEKENFDKAAKMTHDIYQSYIDAGFTEEQAWELLKLAFLTNNRRR